MAGRIVYPNRSRFGSSIVSRLFGSGKKEPECPCITCKKQGECIDYMLYGPVFSRCNDPGKYSGIHGR